MCLEQTKRCQICLETKPFSEFEKQHGGKVGYRCKACAAAYKREVYHQRKLPIQLNNRIAKLKNFCASHGIEINIEVLNDESKWY